MVYSVIPLSTNLRQSILGGVSFWYHERHVAAKNGEPQAGRSSAAPVHREAGA